MLASRLVPRTRRQTLATWLARYTTAWPAEFARVLPYYIETGETPEVASEAEVDVMLKELGLPVGLIEHMQTAPAPLDPDEIQDPYGLNTPVSTNGTGNDLFPAAYDRRPP
jgi:hypothetical protein